MMTRWKATVHYRTDSGIVDVTHDLEELADIDDVVERGPHWDTIVKVEIVRGEFLVEGLTVEGAERL